MPGAGDVEFQTNRVWGPVQQRGAWRARQHWAGPAARIQPPFHAEAGSSGRNFYFLFLLSVTNDLPLRCGRPGKPVVMETGSAGQGDRYTMRFFVAAS